MMTNEKTMDKPWLPGMMLAKIDDDTVSCPPSNQLIKSVAEIMSVTAMLISSGYFDK